MSSLSDMIWIELRKVLRSKIPLFTVLGSLFMPVGIALLIYIAKNPAISEKLGLISAKANLMQYSATNWPSYLGLSGQIVSAGGFFLFVFAISWVFGREFADRTLKDMLAVPVSRGVILLAKYIVVAIWSIALTIVMLILGLALGVLIGFPSVPFSDILQGIGIVFLTACLSILVVLPFALFASVGRGYLLPVGVAILCLITANLVMVLGLGEYFPWAIPLLFAQGKSALAMISYWITAITGLGGMAATYLWWKLADQNR